MHQNTFDAISRWQSRLNNVLIEYFIFSSMSNSEVYGGEIIEQSQKYFENVKIPTVYSIIKRSIEIGLIEKLPEQEKADMTRGTARQYYKLTKEGLVFLTDTKEYLDRSMSQKILNQLEEGL